MGHLYRHVEEALETSHEAIKTHNYYLKSLDKTTSTLIKIQEKVDEFYPARDPKRAYEPVASQLRYSQAHIREHAGFSARQGQAPWTPHTV